MAKEEAMTPVAAVARHLEWLEFALAAARDEEARRRDRLGNASDKNREKRTVRLAEVTAEVRELAALVLGLKALKSPAASRAAGSGRRSPRSTAKSTSKATPRRRTTPKSTAAATATAATTAAPPPAATKPRVTRSTKPKATRKTTTRKPAVRRRSTKPSAPSN